MDFSVSIRIYLFAFFLLVLGLFINLGKQPLFLEEPRRVMIAMEIQENANPFVPTQLGEPYYRKPPFFNWVLNGSAALFGGYSEWAMRFPTVCSVLLISIFIFLITDRFINRETALLSALLLPICSGIMFYFSTLAEIDLFYSLITFLSILSIFFFDQKGNHWLLFSATYSLGAIGVLTKGLPSIPFIGLSLLAYFIYQKRFRELFSLAHLLGIVLFATIVGGYVWLYQQEGSILNLLITVSEESGNRTLASNGFIAFMQHLFLFPLQTLGDMMPGSLLLLYAFRKDFFQVVRENKLVHFCFWMFVANYWVYWISPGAKMRYIYMLYPFIMIVLAYFFLNKRDQSSRINFFFERALQALLLLMPIAAILVPFIPELHFLKTRYWIAGVAFLVFASLNYSVLKRKLPVFLTFLIAILCIRIVFDLTVLPQRADDSDGQKNKDLAHQILDITKDQPLYIWKAGRFSFTTVYYINKEQGKTLRRKYEVEEGAYYLANKKWIPDHPHDSYLSFPYHEEEYHLVKFK